jgi:uncharacterized protein (DUF697 family)
MIDETASSKKIQRTRKRVYENAEPADSVDISRKADERVVDESIEQNALATASSATDRDAKALAIVKHYTLWAAAVGVVPVPILDMVTMLAVQMKMVQRLAELYEVPYSEQRVKSALAGLIGGYEAAQLGGGALKMFPVIGLFSLAAMPTMNAAIAYAVGRVFIQHFCSGGTFLDFNPAKMRAYFEEKYREGKLKK